MGGLEDVENKSSEDLANIVELALRDSLNDRLRTDALIALDDLVTRVQKRERWKAAEGRNERQESVAKWVRETFTEAAMTVMERVARFTEESIELAQAEGMAWDDFMKIATRVYSKTPGRREQEVGGVGVTLLAYCQTRGISADLEEQREFARVKEIPIAQFRKRHNLKADAGIAVRVAEEDPK